MVEGFESLEIDAVLFGMLGGDQVVPNWASCPDDTAYKAVFIELALDTSLRTGRSSWCANSTLSGVRAARTRRRLTIGSAAAPIPLWIKTFFAKVFFAARRPLAVAAGCSSVVLW
jgi:hypothetical protein